MLKENLFFFIFFLSIWTPVGILYSFFDTYHTNIQLFINFKKLYTKAKQCRKNQKLFLTYFLCTASPNLNNVESENPKIEFNDLASQVLAEENTVTNDNAQPTVTVNNTDLIQQPAISKPDEIIFARLFHLGLQYNKQITFITLTFGVILAILFPQKTRSILNKTKYTITHFIEKIKASLSKNKENKILPINRQRS